MDRAEVLRIAQEAFPSGPERIADRLGAEVRYAAINVDGWCLVPPSGRPRIIMLNQGSPRTRQRFTLAHEVAHLILGTQPEVVGRGDRDLNNPTSPEEKAANQLASELLLPLLNVQPLFPLPIDSRSIAAAAEAAVVSEVVLALRLVSKSAAFGLRSPVVAKLTDGTIEWKVPFDQPLPDDVAAELYSRALQSGGTTRVRSTEEEAVLVCALGNPTYPVLFYYWLPPDYETRETPAEHRFRLEVELLDRAAPEIRQRLNGCFGAFKTRVKAMNLSQAVAEFRGRYRDNLDRLFPEELIEEYLRLRLGAWGLKD